MKFSLLKELSNYHGLIVTDTKQYTNYIPRYIEQMDNIVADTYERTRGESEMNTL